MIVEKALKMAEKMNVPVLGIVENMSYLVCPDCGKKIPIFGESHIADVAMAHHVPVLAQIPVDPRIAAFVDAGKIEELEQNWMDDVADMLLRSQA